MRAADGWVPDDERLRRHYRRHRNVEPLWQPPVVPESHPPERESNPLALTVTLAGIAAALIIPFLP